MSAPYPVDTIVFVRARVVSHGGDGDWWSYVVETVDRLGRPNELSVITHVRDGGHVISAADARRVLSAAAR